MPELGYQVWRTGKTHTTPRSVFQFDEIPGFGANTVRRTGNFFTDSLQARMQNTNKPFCLFVCSHNPHAPWTLGDPTVFDQQKIVLPPIMPDTEDIREIYSRYLAEIGEFDLEVGAVLKLLEETGQLDNTLIIVLGEQGAKFPGGKWTLWDYGVNSVMIARYPSNIKAGTVTDVLVQYEDILPTLIDFIGGKPVSELDGTSFLPALFGRKREIRKWAYGCHNNVPEGTPYPIRSIRSKRYKLIWNLTPDVDYLEKHVMNSRLWSSWLYGDEHAKKMADRYIRRPEFEFYDMKNDPWEMNNLATQPKHAKRIATMKRELENWMQQQGDLGIPMDAPNHNERRIEQRQQQLEALKDHNRAVHISEELIQAPYIFISPRDDYYYLTGTTDHRIRIWRSIDLAEWEAFNVQFVLNEGHWAQKHPEAFNESDKEWSVTAPEMYYEQGKWLFVHGSSSPFAGGSNLVVSNGIVHRQVSFPMGDDMYDKHDPSLFRDDCGTWYLIWANVMIAPIKPDFTGFAAEPKHIDAANRSIGHGGATIRKIGDKYVLFATAWSTDQTRKGSYNLYYCTADNIYGPYSERRFVGRFLGHGTPFQDKDERWWCTAFFNANVPPLPSEGIEQRDLSQTAQTINPQGTTIVPLDVRILDNGDIYIRAKDPRYGTIGPDENDYVELNKTLR